MDCFSSNARKQSDDSTESNGELCDLNLFYANVLKTLMYFKLKQILFKDL